MCTCLLACNALPACANFDSMDPECRGQRSHEPICNIAPPRVVVPGPNNHDDDVKPHERTARTELGKKLLGAKTISDVCYLSPQAMYACACTQCMCSDWQSPQK